MSVYRVPRNTGANGQQLVVDLIAVHFAKHLIK